MDSVALVVPGYGRNVVGGSERLVRCWARLLSSAYRVDIITTLDGSDDGIAADGHGHNIHVHRFRAAPRWHEVPAGVSPTRSIRETPTCRALRLKHDFTRPYRPQTNGKAERFIQSALRAWAYGIPYQHSTERTAMLKRWTHHYNWHRPHQGIGGIAPMSRLSRTRNNLLTLHS